MFPTLYTSYNTRINNKFSLSKLKLRRTPRNNNISHAARPREIVTMRAARIHAPSRCGIKINISDDTYFFCGLPDTQYNNIIYRRISICKHSGNSFESIKNIEFDITKITPRFSSADYSCTRILSIIILFVYKVHTIICRSL